MNSPRELELPFVRLHRLCDGQHTDAALVLWLNWANRKTQRTENFIDRLREEGVAIDISSSHELSNLQLDNYDLILLSVNHVQYGRIDDILSAIRRISLAPVMLLTEQHTLDWYVSAVRAGADAVADARTPGDVLLAHCRALLRRWRSSP